MRVTIYFIKFWINARAELSGSSKWNCQQPFNDLWRKRFASSPAQPSSHCLLFVKQEIPVCVVMMGQRSDGRNLLFCSFICSFFLPFFFTASWTLLSVKLQGLKWWPWSGCLGEYMNCKSEGEKCLSWGKCTETHHQTSLTVPCDEKAFFKIIFRKNVSSQESCYKTLKFHI